MPALNEIKKRNRQKDFLSLQIATFSTNVCSDSGQDTTQKGNLP